MDICDSRDAFMTEHRIKAVLYHSFAHTGIIISIDKNLVQIAGD